MITVVTNKSSYLFSIRKASLINYLKEYYASVKKVEKKPFLAPE